MRSIFLSGLVFPFLTTMALAQNQHEQHIKMIKARSELYNTSYNSRDSLSFFSLFDSSAVVVSLGGKWIGLEKCKYLCRSLYAKIREILDNVVSQGRYVLYSVCHFHASRGSILE